jgi:hypothetical protein
MKSSSTEFTAGLAQKYFGLSNQPIFQPYQKENAMFCIFFFFRISIDSILNVSPVYYACSLPYTNNCDLGLHFL